MPVSDYAGALMCEKLFGLTARLPMDLAHHVLFLNVSGVVQRVAPRPLTGMRAPNRSERDHRVAVPTWQQGFVLSPVSSR